MIKSKIKTSLACLIILAGFVAVPMSVSAGPVPAGGSPAGTGSSQGSQTTDSSSTPTAGQVQSQLNNNPIVGRINDIVNFLSAVVGIVIVGNLIAGGIEYSTAGGSPQKVGEARKRIMNSFLALFAFLFLWAFANWLIPGGVFG